MMDQKRIGAFLAALRKEKKLTQEQLAERLGVNSRSISRWENGYCMPDLSLLQILADELGVSVPELLNGKYLEKEETAEQEDSICTLIRLANQEKRQKAKKLNRYFGSGLACLMAAVLWIWFCPSKALAAYIFAGLGLLLELLGFYHNQSDAPFTQRELELQSKSTKDRDMQTAREMMQFTGKYRKNAQKPYELAFREIEKSLEPGEAVLFAAAGSSYTRNELPSMWYAALAVTPNRILIGGQRMKGTMLISYAVESFPVCEILSIQQSGAALIMKTLREELKIEEGNPETVRILTEDLNEIIKKIKQ